MQAFLFYFLLQSSFGSATSWPLAIQHELNPAALVDAVLEEEEDTTCTILSQLDSHQQQLFETRWPAHYCFLKAACLSDDIEKADSVRWYAVRAQQYLQATKAKDYPFHGERQRRRAMQRYLKYLLEGLEQVKPVRFVLGNPVETEPTLSSDKLETSIGQMIVRNNSYEPLLTRMLATNIISDSSSLHWRGITMDEFDQGLTLHVSKKPSILDSLYLHVPRIVIPMEDYLYQSRQYVVKMEIEADITAGDLGVMTDSVYTGGEVIYRKPWFLGTELKRATLPSGARLRKEEQLLLKMMKAGWYFRLSLDDASYISEPEYKILVVNGEPRQDLRIHYLFQQKN